MSYGHDKFNNANDQWREMYGQSAPYSNGASSSTRTRQTNPTRDSLISDDDDSTGFGTPRNHHGQRFNSEQMMEFARNSGGAPTGHASASRLDYLPRNEAAFATHASANDGMDMDVNIAYAAARNYAAETSGTPSFVSFSGNTTKSSDSYSREDRFSELNQPSHSYDRHDSPVPSYATRGNLDRATSEVLGTPSAALRRSSSDVGTALGGMTLNKHITSDSFDSGSVQHSKMPGVIEESDMADLANTYSSTMRAREDAMDRSSSTQRSNTLHPKPLPKEGRAMPPPNITVEATMGKPRLSRRWNTGNSKRRQPDVLRGVNTVKTRDKSSIPADEHVVGCLHCRKFCQVKKVALLVTCASCNKVSPASQGNKASQ
jgi:hypothetical protein